MHVCSQEFVQYTNTHGCGHSNIQPSGYLTLLYLYSRVSTVDKIVSKQETTQVWICESLVSPYILHLTYITDCDMLGLAN